MRITRCLSLVLLTAVLTLVGTAPAGAHVLLDTAVPRGDGSVEIALTYDHSCTGSPTVEMSVEMPEGAELLSGTGPDGWSATIQGSRIVFAGPGIGDGQNPQFRFVARLSGSVGQTLLFPTRQTCADGNGYEWSDETESTERPAPRLVATQATLDRVVPPASPAGRVPASLPDDGAGPLQLVVALVLLAAGTYGASRVLLRSQR